jgi:enoyl-CoA hydratase
MTGMTEERIRVERPHPEVARVCLARPRKRNAQDPRLLRELDDALTIAARDDEVRVIILAADGPDFSAGHDLSCGFELDGEPSARVGGDYDAPGIEGHLAFEEEMYLGLSLRWRHIDKPTIAQVQGRVIAGGLMLVWPMDLIVAADDARFSDPVAAFGVNGAEYFAHAFELGHRRAKYLLFTGGSIDAAEAHAIGMVSEVVPRDRLEERTLELAVTIAGRNRLGLKLAKRSVDACLDQQGYETSMRAAFGYHQLGHAHNLHQFGSIVPPGLKGSK